MSDEIRMLIQNHMKQHQVFLTEQNPISSVQSAPGGESAEEGLEQGLEDQLPEDQQ